MSDENNEDNEEINLDLEALEIELNHSRVKSMAIFSVLTKTEFLGLRNNMIKKVEGLNQLMTLKELELYDNQITKIENLDSLTNLELVLNSWSNCSLFCLLFSFIGQSFGSVFQ